MAARRFSFEAIGTKWAIDSTSDVSESDWGRLQTRISERIELFDRTYSRFRKDSWVRKLSEQAGTHDLPEDALPLISFYKLLYDMTGGLVTPFIGQAVSDAGYDAQYSLTSKVLHAPPGWEETMSYSQDALTMRQPALLDFGAAGKGYLVDIIGKLMRESGISEFVINAGGDMLHRSRKTDGIEVGLENPFDTSEIIGTVRIVNQSLCASAGSKRAWGKYHHMINPATLESPREIVASWVVTDSAMHADGLATALFFVEAQQLLGQLKFEYAILDKDMVLRHSKDLKVKPFEADA